jgi:hypothetical protein
VLRSTNANQWGMEAKRNTQDLKRPGSCGAGKRRNNTVHIGSHLFQLIAWPHPAVPVSTRACLVGNSVSAVSCRAACAQPLYLLEASGDLQALTALWTKNRHQYPLVIGWTSREVGLERVQGTKHIETFSPTESQQAYYLLALFTVRPRSRKQYIPPKRSCISTRLRMSPESGERPASRADNLTAISEPTV